MDINEPLIRSFASDFRLIDNEVGKHIIGQRDVIRDILTAIVAGGNVLLEGLPGLGKTQLVKTVAKVLDLNFSRIQFTPDLMPQDVTGSDILIRGTDGSSDIKFNFGPIFSNIVLADEINRATPKTQSALLEAMQEGTVTSGKVTHVLPKPFFVLATQNPIEMEGTYPLPEAQLDRFMFKTHVSYPTQDELFEIVNITTVEKQVEINKICGGDKILSMRGIAAQVPVARAVADYAMNLILKTHPDSKAATENTKKYIRYGASPRGAQAIITASRIYALLDGRFNVSYEDIKKAAYPVLRHRIFLNFEAIADGVTADGLIAGFLESK